MDNKMKTACAICGGAGGWKIEKARVIESNWCDCLYCNGLGFVEVDEDTFTDPFLLRYNHYRKLITELLTDGVARVDAFGTTDAGNRIEIIITPYNRPVFVEFVKYILKLGHYSTTIKIGLVQDFYYKPNLDKFASHWKVILEPKTLNDLDGFIDTIKLWDKKEGFYA